MKKIIKFITIIGILFSLSGCIREDNSNCPIGEEEEPFNISLDFLLPDGNNGCMFMSAVSTVDMHIYDSEENLVLARYVTPEELQVYKGVKLMLPAGAYNVVAWGNLSDDCVYHDMKKSADPYESSIVFDPLVDRFGHTSGKIYYAPRSGAYTRSAHTRSSEMPECHPMNVDPITGYKGTLEFRPAHRIIKVYVEGYNGTPMIEFVGLPMGLSWLGMNRLSQSSSGIITSIMKITEPHEKDGIIYDYVTFETFHFDGSNDIILQVISPQTEDVFYSILLNDVLEDIYDPDKIEISVLLKFTPGGVEISVPEWTRKDVEPGIGV